MYRPSLTNVAVPPCNDGIRLALLREASCWKYQTFPTKTGHKFLTFLPSRVNNANSAARSVYTRGIVKTASVYRLFHNVLKTLQLFKQNILAFSFLSYAVKGWEHSANALMFWCVQHRLVRDRPKFKFDWNFLKPRPPEMCGQAQNKIFLGFKIRIGRILATQLRCIFNKLHGYRIRR